MCLNSRSVLFDNLKAMLSDRARAKYSVTWLKLKKITVGTLS